VCSLTHSLPHFLSSSSHTQVLHDNPKARREVELHWRVSGCRHIVNIVDVFENTYSGTKCLLVVMECMEGGELFQRIQDRTDGPFTEREAAQIMHEICLALKYLHERNIGNLHNRLLITTIIQLTLHCSSSRSETRESALHFTQL